MYAAKYGFPDRAKDAVGIFLSFLPTDLVG